MSFRRLLNAIACGVALARAAAAGTAAPTPPEAVRDAEAARIAAMQRAAHATVAVFDAAGAGGGSAVLITPDGFALTNFHVTAPCGPAMKCGLDDGRLYDAVIVGIDPVGDLALIQLLGRDDFPVAPIGDSDQAAVGDRVFAAGNPFLLAEDFQPSLSYGILSGVHRYQYPAGTLLEYADCLQTDAAINPGNSGGPLFDAAGKLIGVNGRCSFEKRGRVNVGVGYAISINQAMRFLSHLQSGRIVDHASLGATVATNDANQAVVDDVLEGSDAWRRGLQYGDVIERLAGRDVRSANALKNVLGTFPAPWRTTLAVRRDGEALPRRVRLTPLHGEAELIELVQGEQAKPSEPPVPGRPDQEEPDQTPDDGPAPDSSPPRRAKPAELPSAVAQRYEARRGFANYWYNRQALAKIWRRYAEGARVAGMGYQWRIAAADDAGRPVTIDVQSDEGRITLADRGDFAAQFTGDLSQQLSPPRSGGLLVALRAWQRLLDKGPQQFGELIYLGRLPHGSNNQPEECLSGLFAGMEVRLFFGDAEGDLTGIELFSADDADPCEIEFSQFASIGGRRLPRQWTVVCGDQRFAQWRVSQWETGARARRPPAAKEEE